MSVDFVFSPHNQYAVTCMMMFARAKEPLTVAELAERLSLSRPYTTDFVGAFEKHGLIKKGTHFRAGYSLAKESSEITLGDILAAERDTWYHHKFKRRGTFAPDFHEVLLWRSFVMNEFSEISLERLLGKECGGKAQRNSGSGDA